MNPIEKITLAAFKNERNDRTGGTIQLQNVACATAVAAALDVKTFFLTFADLVESALLGNISTTLPNIGQLRRGSWFSVEPAAWLLGSWGWFFMPV